MKIRNFILSVMLILMGSISADAALYAVGGGNLGNWISENAVEFTLIDNVYTLQIDETTTEFKISTAKGNWDAFNSGVYGLVEGETWQAQYVKNGQTATLYAGGKDNIALPWAGDWTITVSGDLKTLTATTETPEPAPALYILGSFQGWDPANSYAMTYSECVYSISGLTFSGNGNNFSFTTVKSSNWETVNANRYGFKTDNAVATVGVEMPIAKVNGDCAIQVPEDGIYSIYANLTAMTVKVERTGEVEVEVPAELYIFGTLVGASWDPENAIEMTSDGNVFTAEVNLEADASGLAYFGFAEFQSSDWEELKDYRFAPVGGETAFAVGEECGIKKGTDAFVVNIGETGSYVIVADFDNYIVKVTKSSGIEHVEINEEKTPIVYYNLQGVPTVNPQKGLYIVKRNNKAVKVWR